MPKKCIICGESAKYAIKGTSDFYCEECAEDSFSDITLLEKVEDRKLDDDAEEELEEAEEGEEQTNSKKKHPADEDDDDDSDFDDDDDSDSEEE